jgi:hypothetical protein
MGTRKDVIMHLLTKSMLALGFVGAIGMGAPTASVAQGVYIEGPGVSIGVGPPYRERHYYRYYDYDRPAVRVRPYAERRVFRYRHWDWD